MQGRSGWGDGVLGWMSRTDFFFKRKSESVNETERGRAVIG